MVRHGRLLTSEQNYRLALDELSNQLDRLTALPGNEFSLAVKELQLTPFTAERLSDVKLVWRDRTGGYRAARHLAAHLARPERPQSIHGRLGVSFAFLDWWTGQMKCRT